MIISFGLWETQVGDESSRSVRFGFTNNIVLPS